MISMRAVVLSRSSPRLATTASFFDGTQPFIPTGPSHSTKFEQVIKTTQTLDGNIVPRLLAPADEVIERPPCLFMCRFLGRLHHETIEALGRQASEKRQGTKSRAGRGSRSEEHTSELQS